MRPRFSLRTFFLATALIAAFCYYWMVRPTATANQCVEAVSNEQYNVMDQLFVKSTDAYFQEWHDECDHFEARANVSPWSLNQFLQGERRVTFSITSGALGRTRGVQGFIVAKPWGLLTPQLTGFGGGMGGGGLAARYAK